MTYRKSPADSTAHARGARTADIRARVREAATVTIASDVELARRLAFLLTKGAVANEKNGPPKKEPYSSWFWLSGGSLLCSGD